MKEQRGGNAWSGHPLWEGCGGEGLWGITDRKIKMKWFRRIKKKRAVAKAARGGTQLVVWDHSALFEFPGSDLLTWISIIHSKINSCTFSYPHIEKLVDRMTEFIEASFASPVGTKQKWDSKHRQPNSFFIAWCLCANGKWRFDAVSDLMLRAL